MINCMSIWHSRHISLSEKYEIVEFQLLPMIDIRVSGVVEPKQLLCNQMKLSLHNGTHVAVLIVGIPFVLKYCFIDV